jgi:hypothetical protein
VLIQRNKQISRLKKEISEKNVIARFEKDRAMVQRKSEEEKKRRYEEEEIKRKVRIEEEERARVKRRLDYTEHDTKQSKWFKHSTGYNY